MDIYNLVLSGICFLFFVFALNLIFTRKQHQALGRLLAIIIFARIGQMMIYLSVRGGYIEAFSILYRFFSPLYYLMPAALYLYISRLLGGDKEKKRIWLHFIPFLIAIVHFIPWKTELNVDWQTLAYDIEKDTQIFIRQRTGLFPAVFLFYFRIVLLISYLIASWVVFVKSDLFKQKVWSRHKIWISFILCLATAFHLISLLPIWIPQDTKSYPWFIMVNCVGLIIIILYILHKPGLLYNYLLVNVKIGEQPVSGSKKEKGSGVIVQDMNKKTVGIQQGVHGQDLEKLMQTKQLFLNPNLQIIDLASEMGISVHQCSALVNTVTGKSFRDWINSHRILFFIATYPEQKNCKTVEAIANEAGFKSLSTFYKAFKKETELMPKQYFSNKEAP